MNLTLRPMTADDLVLVERWLHEPHVARWWTEPVEREIADYRACLAGTEPTRPLIVEVGAVPVGWAQWYRWADYSDDAAQVGASVHEVGIDYAIGEPVWVHRGVGTALIAALVAEIHAARPDAAFLVDVAPDNRASRRVLERNGFALAGQSDTAAIYRLSAQSPSPGTPARR